MINNAKLGSNLNVLLTLIWQPLQPPVLLYRSVTFRITVLVGPQGIVWSIAACFSFANVFRRKIGFLTTADGHAPGNYALLDQVAALHWIADNIEAFGGDSSAVTLFGDRVGGAMVGLLMMSPIARGNLNNSFINNWFILIFGNMIYYNRCSVLFYIGNDTNRIHLSRWKVTYNKRTAIRSKYEKRLYQDQLCGSRSAALGQHKIIRALASMVTVASPRPARTFGPV